MRFLKIFAILLTLGSLSYSADIVSLEVEFREAWQDKPDSFIVADYATLKLVLGEDNSAWVGSVSLVLNPVITDQNTLQLRADFFGLPPKIKSFFKQVTLKKDQTQEVAQLPGKPGRVYRILFKNWQLVRDENACTDNPQDTSLWVTDFSVHFNFHFPKNSLADYHWNYNKTYLENEFSRTRRFFNVYPLNKIELYYQNCPYRRNWWNSSLGFALFPARGEVRLLYSPQTKSIDSPHFQMFMFLNQWGYAPQFLTYGLAGYFKLNHYYAKEYSDQGKLVPLVELFNSALFRKQEQRAAFYQAASWVRFLIDKFGREKIMDFYKEVSDINVVEATQKYFGNLNDLESEWREFLKNYQPSEEELHFFAKLAIGLRNYPEALALYRELQKTSPEHRISDQLGNSCYLLGDYAQAVNYYEKWVKEENLRPQRHFILGNMYWLNGDLKSAEKEFSNALSQDPYYAPAQLYLARLEYDQKNFADCQSLLEQLSLSGQSPEDAIEFYLLKAQLHKTLGQSGSADSAAYAAYLYAVEFVRKNPEESTPYLLLGRAYLANDSLFQAEQILSRAELLEDRAYYVGQVNLYLGELYQEKEELKLARSYYEKVLQNPSGFREKSIARERLSGL